MDKPSPLDTLRQLKEMLDAGAITQDEFNKLKQQLLFGDAPAAPAAPAAPLAEPLINAPTAPISVPPVVVETPAPPAEPQFIPPPVDDPLLPPVVSPTARPLEPVVLDAETYRPTEGPLTPPPPVYSEPEPVEEARQSPLGMILIIGGVVALLAIIGYLVLGNRSSERLTSNSITAADTTAVAVEEGPQAAQLDLPPVQAPETVRVQPNIPVAPVTSDTATAGPDAAAVNAAATQAQVQRVLTAFYADLQTPPFSAAQYFAPQVEQFLQMKNTTPAAIDEDLSRGYFPDRSEIKVSLVPGTLQVNTPDADGSVTATFQEKSRSLRKSLNQYQQTLTQVRARFDATGKLTYFRQERLLENTFTDAKPAAAPATDAATPPQE